MKKMLFSLVIAGLMSTSLMAVDGPVSYIKAKGDGSIIVAVVDTANGDIVKGKLLVGSADAVKAMLAVSLTAKSIGKDITANVGTINDTTGWAAITIK